MDGGGITALELKHCTILVNPKSQHILKDCWMLFKKYKRIYIYEIK